MMAIVGDVYEIESRLLEIDPELMLSFNRENGNYNVYHKNQFVMEWPRPLDARLLVHMRKIDIRRGYDPLKEIDDHNEKLEKSIDRDRFNHIEAVAKDYHRQIANEL